MNAFILRLYSLLMWLAQPQLRRKMIKRAVQEPGYAEATEERFGHYTQPPEASSSLVWVHAVSLGETRTASILITALRARHPDIRILLTHGTATGRAEGQPLLCPGDLQVWQPWDSLAEVARFFNHFKPRLGLLMETEVWPCLVATAKSRGMPLVLVNGRLSEKTLQQALRLSLLSYPAYGCLTAIYAQTASDAKRYCQLGVEAAGVFGNLKFDITPSESLQATGKAWRKAFGQPVVMFASSRDGEEILFLEEIVALAQQIRVQAATDSIAIKYFIVPRHPQRFDEVAALVGRFGLTVSRRSSWVASPFESMEAMRADIWLGDSLGEMPLYYALSDVALLGGSFERLGGQNLIEAAACACPVVMGLHTFNFNDAAELAEAAGAAVRVADMPAALQAALNLVSQPALQQGMAAAALAFAASNRGATAQTLAALQPYLKPLPISARSD